MARCEIKIQFIEDEPLTTLNVFLIFLRQGGKWNTFSWLVCLTWGVTEIYIDIDVMMLHLSLSCSGRSSQEFDHQLHWMMRWHHQLLWIRTYWAWCLWLWRLFRWAQHFHGKLRGHNISELEKNIFSLFNWDWSSNRDIWRQSFIMRNSTALWTKSSSAVRDKSL